MKYPLFVPSALLLASCGGVPDTDSSPEKGADLIENVPSIIGMTKAAIDAEWGEPNCPPKNSCEYGDRLTVYFVEGRAANVTLPPVDDVNEYGFEVGSPSFENTGVIRWEIQIGEKPAQLSSFDENFVYLMTVDPSTNPTSTELKAPQ
ncbi:MAG: hypothetical protein AAF291_11195 [Pseudomonadota bacterium]